MKKTLYSLFFLLCVTFNEAQTSSVQLLGNWVWIESSGGFGGDTFTPKTEGHTNTVSFCKKGKYKEWKNAKLVNEYSYTINANAQSIFNPEGADVISYKNLIKPTDEIMKDSFEFKGMDTLVLKNECRDCFVRLYVRKKHKTKK